MQTLLRANMLAAQMSSSSMVPQGQPIGPAGSAIARRFRDDTEDVANLVDGMVDIFGGVVFTVIAADRAGRCRPLQGGRGARDPAARCRHRDTVLDARYQDPRRTASPPRV